MEIEFWNDDSGEDLSYGNKECLFCTGLFSHDSLAKNWLNVWGAIVGRMKTVGLKKTNLCAPCAEKV
jgi:hypothetical protein